MSEILLWLLCLGNTFGVLVALVVGRMALRRIRLDRSHIAELEVMLGNTGQPSLALKRKQYVELATAAVEAQPYRATILPIQSCSQHGEDLLLWDFFGRKLNGFYLEIGAHDGFTLSNTYFFESIGWKGICIEANPDLAKRAAELRSRSLVVHAACGERSASGTVAFQVGVGPAWASSLSTLETKHLLQEELTGHDLRFETIEVPYTSAAAVLGAVSVLDFVTIDVEGSELKVLHGFDFSRLRPTVLVIEDNSKGTDTAVSEFLATVGYRKVLSVNVNDFYVECAEARHFRL